MPTNLIPSHCPPQPLTARVACIASAILIFLSVFAPTARAATTAFDGTWVYEDKASGGGVVVIFTGDQFQFILIEANKVASKNLGTFRADAKYLHLSFADDTSNLMRFAWSSPGELLLEYTEGQRVPLKKTDEKTLARLTSNGNGSGTPAPMPSQTPAPVPAQPPSPSPARAPGPAPSSPPVNPVAMEGRREVELQAVYFTNGNPPGGGTSPIQLMVEPNTRKRPSVGVVEQFSGGTGDQFTGAVWMAAFNACNVRQCDISDFRFLLDLEGFIDGPSAGMLMTSGFLTLLFGDAVLPQTTMTGAVNLDGSAGPVGGIPQKIQGAAAKGFKRFGFPVGCRMAEDMATKQQVDVIEFGKKHGVEVREIRDLWEAYEFLTGKALPRPRALSAGEMALDADVAKDLRNDITFWRSRSDGYVRFIEQAFADYKAAGMLSAADSTRASITQAQTFYRLAESMLQRGQIAGAWRKHAEAAMLMGTVQAQLEIMMPIFQGNVQQAQALIEKRATVAAELDKLGGKFSAQALSESLDGTIAAVSGLSAFVQGVGFLQKAEQNRATTAEIQKLTSQGKLDMNDPQNTTVLVSSLLQPHLWYALSESLAIIAERNLMIASSDGLGIHADPAALQRLSTGYASAAVATQGYFEALVIKANAEAAGLPASQIEQFLTVREGDYPSVQFATTYAARLQQSQNQNRSSQTQQGDDATLRLGASTYAYLRLASLVNKWYSLQPNFSDTGALTSLGNADALAHQMRTSELRAREAAALCKAKLGFVPAAAKYNYQLAAAFQSGGPDDQLSALDAWWEATFWSDFARAIAKK